jgi:S1-C subfamily serine protease
VARVVTVFDVWSRPREVLFCDDAGRPVLTRRGYSRYRQAYDEGRPAKRSYYDLAGKSVSTHVVVMKVAPGSQAQRLGLKAGDVLVRYDGRPVLQAGLFIRGRQAESKTAPPRSLVVQRQERLMILQVSPGLLGVEVDDAVKDEEGKK